MAIMPIVRGVLLLAIGILVTIVTFFSGLPIYFIALGPVAAGIGQIIRSRKTLNPCPQCGKRGPKHVRHDGRVCGRTYPVWAKDAPNEIGTAVCDCGDLARADL